MSEINTYKKSAKGIFLFGGIQIYKILLSIIKTKCSAIFLGPAGYGIYSLITLTLNTLELATNCGLGTSSVKDIAQADGDNDLNKISENYKVLNRLVWFTGLLGAVLCLISSNKLSIWSFGNADYTIAFALTSLTLLLNQLVSGQGALLIGLKKYKYIARLNLWTNTISLIVTVSLYYLWGIDAIVPVILITSIASLIFSIYYASKIALPVIKVPLKEVWSKGKDMFKRGIYISLSYALMLLGAYLIRIYISQMSGIAQVGLFTAIFSLVNTYVGMIFSSIEKDYYPRLSTCSKEKIEFNTTINQQSEILLLMLSPIITAFIIYAPILIKVFYTSKFISAEGMMCITTLSMFFKGPAWALSISFLAKGDTKPYLINQISFITYQLLFNIFFYKYWGLVGIGFSYLISHIIYLAQTTINCKRSYGYRLSNAVLKKLIIYGLLLTICCIVSFSDNQLLRYILGSLLFVLISIASIIELNAKTKLLKTIKQKIRK